MAGTSNAPRREAAREVRLVVNGESVPLNGFVQDLLQETVVGIVRALQRLDEDAPIQLTIGPAGGERSSSPT